MSERSHYHFSLTLTPKQYELLLKTLTYCANNAELDREKYDEDALFCEYGEKRQMLEDAASDSEEKSAILSNIHQAILNQMIAEPKV